jgi:hypothetical protein
MYEMEVKRMEKEELELINRLKDTKILEEQAHNQLENALTDPNLLKTRSYPDASSRSANQRSSKKK